MIKLPGLIDPHVHLRDPGQIEREDFYTGTCAALAGGYTTVIDMPNNAIPITSKKLLLEKRKIAQKKIVCDVGFHFGSLGDNFDEFKNIKPYVCGLKVYLNITTGNFIIDEKIFEKIVAAWPNSLPILVHAEEDILEAVLTIANKYNQKIHVCHVSSAKELQLVINAKQKSNLVTCGVTPHHLFLSNKDIKHLGNFSKVKPYLKSENDVAFLWKHFTDIDIVESDHAPQLIKDKLSANPPFGMPGLETTLPLLLSAVHNNKLLLDDIKKKCYLRPKEIFNLPEQPDTITDVDENEEWKIQNDKLQTKCKWSPFDGWKVKGKVKRVIIRGTKVFEDGKILVTPGYGKIIEAN